jgi:hypothetical protein
MQLSHLSKQRLKVSSNKMLPEPLQEALERSLHELLMLAKLYHKHGFYKQAQEIYYYILSIQARRDNERNPEQTKADSADRVRSPELTLNHCRLTVVPSLRPSRDDRRGHDFAQPGCLKRSQRS